MKNIMGLFEDSSFLTGYSCLKLRAALKIVVKQSVPDARARRLQKEEEKIFTLKAEWSSP